MSEQVPRVRFAPSPTGYMHVGGLRTALFNWLFARNQGGTFILRFEDTDQARVIEDAAASIMDSLQWLGLDWDEGPRAGGAHGPYWQSQRLQFYQEHAETLLEQGRIYRDWTLPQDLEAMRKAAQKEKRPFKVDRSQLKTDGSPDEPHVLRFAIDESHDPAWDDVVYGRQSRAGSELDDFVCLKSDGWPTYNFANVVDDHLMDISHVLRGDEFLSSTPKFLQLYAAFGWQTPSFVHVPPVHGPDKTKLSKRHGALGALEYRNWGYLPGALINFLATLGWNDGTTQEIFTPTELIDRFSLARIQKSPAVFDEGRLDWINGHHLRALTLDELARRAKGFWPQFAQEATTNYKRQVLTLVHQRLKYLGELPDLTWFFFTDPAEYPEQLDMDNARQWLPRVLEAIESSDFSEADLEERLRGLVAELDVKTGELFKVIRISITGQTAAPGLFETMHVLGAETTRRRLNTVLSRAREVA
jgi:glutamyl-tRNA synthetase